MSEPSKRSVSDAVATTAATVFRGLLGVSSVLACIGAGVYLLSITPAQENNMIASIAHGIGGYCIGKGLYIGADLTR